MLSPGRIPAWAPGGLAIALTEGVLESSNAVISTFHHTPASEYKSGNRNRDASCTGKKNDTSWPKSPFASVGGYLTRPTNLWQIATDGELRVVDRNLLKTKPGSFCLGRGDLLPTERAVMKTHRCTAYEQGRFLLLDRHSGSGRAIHVLPGRFRTKEACLPR